MLLLLVAVAAAVAAAVAVVVVSVLDTNCSIMKTFKFCLFVCLLIVLRKHYYNASLQI